MPPEPFVLGPYLVGIAAIDHLAIVEEIELIGQIECEREVLFD